MRFDEYIDASLYDPAGGFYASGGAAGRRGDFITSPEVGPLFGAVLARWMDGVWERLGRPAGFTVVEAGAGRGTLARSVLAAAPACLADGRYVAVERSDALRAGLPSGIEQLSDLPDGPVTGVVVANELLDNLAFRLLAASDGAWHEVRVGVEDGGFVEVVGEEVEVAGLPEPVDGARIPLQDGAAAWVGRALDLLDRGALLAFDYASTTAELAQRPWDEWLRTYRGHERGGHPLDVPGTQDVTVEVAVDQLPGAPAITTQAAFLRAHGIDDLVEEGRRLWEAGAATGDLAAMRARSRITESEALLDEAGLGGFAALEWKVEAAAS
ncbi:MAG: SAM-dependent methyltransferase [Actinobacteria bacterium]|nr:SAM-dependent methyltransferase [Actinomycetota bacterium]